MDTRQLHYFISVAEHLNFTKAAKEHFIAQTAMSQQILAIEKQLGVNLFVRNTRSVQLTAAGTVFLREAKHIVTITEEAVKKVQLAASGFIGNLKVGFLGPNEKRFLPDFIRRFRHNYPNIKLTFMQDNPETINAYLDNGLLDVAFTIPYDFEKMPEIKWTVLNSDPVCVILHCDHPLANEAKINLAALRHEPFVTFDPKDNHSVFERMMNFCITKGGFTPNIISQHHHLDTVLLMIEAGIGLTLLPDFFFIYGNPNLRFIELQEADFLYSVIAWKQSYTNPSIPIFLKELDIDVDK